MSTNKDETLRQFCDVTGADEGRSKFFLESSNWQLDVALSSFYEHGGNADEAPANPAAAASSLPTLSDSDMESPPGSPLAPPKKDKKKIPGQKFATLDSLQQESSSDEEEASFPKCCCEPKQTVKDELEEDSEYVHEMNKLKKEVERLLCENSALRKELARVANKQSPDENEAASFPKCCCEPKQTVKDELEEDSEYVHEMNKLKKEVERLLCENSALRKELARVANKQSPDENEAGQAFYAGGSERSGQQILGPGKGRKDIVTEVFKSVRERGAVVFEDEPSSTSRGGRSAFSGVGYRLGQTADDAETPSADAAGGNPQAPPGADQPRSVRLRLYREGFTVDSGALRHYTDPDHADFLNCIRRGEIPPELSGTGGEVRVSLEDRRHEECPRHIAKPQPFSGKGHLLGSPTPATVGATATRDVGDRAANQRAAQDAVKVNDTEPVTTIQFRLADGSRLTGRFNHSHTVGDLVAYVSRAEPSYQLQAFVLLTTFPSRELADPAATIAQANVLNSTLLQRLK